MASTMKKMSTFLTRRPSSQSNVRERADGGTPEGDIARGVRLFCESGGPNNAGEEVLHLPGIVELAESSPAAAKEAAYVARKFLSRDNGSRPYVQYNAIMLVRILAENPGVTFTRNIDNKFVATVKDLLRDGRDMSVQQILRETLDNFQYSRGEDETLKPLMTMWSEYKAKMAKKGGYNADIGATQPGSAQPGSAFYPHPAFQNQHQGHGRSKTLPPQHELASRIEEARTSAKLLTQMVQSTPSSEVLGNDLLKEFTERCQAASRSIQGFLAAENPPPDADTSLTLIETNDQLSMALSKHQRAILQARKATGVSPALAPNGNPSPPRQQSGNESTALGASVARTTSGLSNDGPPRLPVPATASNSEDPFDDRNQAPSQDERAEGVPRTATAPAPNAAHEADEDDEEAESPQAERRYRF